MDYQEAEKLFQSARDKSAGKPLQNNTRLLKQGGCFAVRLHNTDVVTIRPDNTFTLNSGGWRTPTTKERINTYSPAQVTQKNGLWYVARYSDLTHLFEDGMKVDHNGYPMGPPVYPAPLEKAKRKVDRLVSKYIKGFVSDIKENGLDDPGGGDCWCCQKDDPMGLDHLFSHFEESYFVPRLLWLAMQRRGNPSICWTMTKTNPEWANDDLRAYFRIRKLGLAEMLVERGTK